MASDEKLNIELLEREAKAWHELSATQYDRKICTLLANINVASKSVEFIDVVLEFISAALRRNLPLLGESRACCAEQLLTLISEGNPVATRLRIQQLLLLAWLQLGAVVKSGPDVVSTSPELPPGVSLPNGSDPNKIADPDLRVQAWAAVEQHNKVIERWSAKQRALRHLNRLATILRAKPGYADDELMQELRVAMLLAPGIPPELRSLLEQDL